MISAKQMPADGIVAPRPSAQPSDSRCFVAETEPLNVAALAFLAVSHLEPYHICHVQKAEITIDAPLPLLTRRFARLATAPQRYVATVQTSMVCSPAP